MTNPIETNGLTKHYRHVKAVDGVSLQVREGEIYAFLGLNGAGKTTTIRMLLGMIKPTAGSCQVLGERIKPGGTKPWERVGYLVETPHAYPELTTRENLEVARRLRPGTPESAVDEIIEKLSLEQYADRRAGELSLGNQQRLGLAKAMLHKPRLLILDEPANGLDPAGIVEVRELLHAMIRDGVTVFMSSHILAEVARLADRVGIIHQGRLMEELSVEELESRRLRRLLVSARDMGAAHRALTALGRSPEENGSGEEVMVLKDRESIQSPEVVSAALAAAGCPPTRLQVDEEGLEEYFLRLVGANGRSENE
jgi:ABC-2 type transport system ATP-binding protein